MNYLRADRLHIGDVLLIKSHGKSSDAIVKVTGGRYSHAAIYAGNLRLFEARTSGVAYSELHLVKVEDHNGELWQFCSVEAYDEIDVYRLPPKARPPDYGTFGFQMRFSSVLSDYNGLDYSLFYRLAEASALGRGVPIFSSLTMRIFGVLTGDNRKELPGPFCSELVVEALSQSGFKVLTTERLPQTLSPSDLSNGAITQFEKVNGCFEAVDPTFSNDDDWMRKLTMHPWPDINHLIIVRRISNRIEVFVNQWLSRLPVPSSSSDIDKTRPPLCD